jgi:large subunit ribosomal protein L19
LKILDPTRARTRLFSEENEDRAKVGDVLMVRFRTGDPFAGVCMNIRRRGVDTAILLRNQVSRVGTEMWVKIYSPTVVGIEIVDRRMKRARRARLYYLRKPKHDRGSLDGLIERYMKNKLATGRGAAKAKRKGTASKSRGAESAEGKGT